MKRIAVIIACLTAVCLCGLGVAFANKDVPTIPAKHVSIQESVDFKGAFLHSARENTDGYSATVKAAKIMSPSEYVESYAPNTSPSYENFDANSLVVLDIAIKNDNSEGYLLVADWKLVCERANEYLVYDGDLWKLSEPVFADLDERVLTCQVAPQSEYTIHLPFRINIDDSEYTQYVNDIKDTRFNLVLTNAPERLVVDVEV